MSKGKQRLRGDSNAGGGSEYVARLCLLLPYRVRRDAYPCLASPRCKPVLEHLVRDRTRPHSFWNMKHGFPPLSLRLFTSACVRTLTSRSLSLYGTRHKIDLKRYRSKPVFSSICRQLRPTLPPVCPPRLFSLAERCWHPNPQMRPEFSEVSLWHFMAARRSACLLHARLSSSIRGICTERLGKGESAFGGV